MQISSHRFPLKSGLRLFLILLILQLGIGPLYPAHAQPGNIRPPMRSKEAGTAETGLTTGLGAVQTQSLIASDPSASSRFGWSVDTSPGESIIGARNADGLQEDSPVANSGAAYIFRQINGGWQQENRLVAKDAELGDAFGAAVAISGSLAAVGATGKDIEGADDAGAVYTFRRQSDGWKQFARIELPDPVEDDSFGTAVALDGRTLVVGANGRDSGFLPESGAAYVFNYSGGEWGLQATLVPFDLQPGMFFGSAVAVDGNIAVIGASELNPEGTRGQGVAYVFRRVNQNWVQEAKLDPNNGRNGDFFGNAVAIDGEVIVVGAQFHDPEVESGRLTNAGSAYVFIQRGGEWVEETQLTADDAQLFAQFGESVTINGGRIVVGASRASTWGLSQAGSAYLFLRKGGEWVQQMKIIPATVEEEGLFGNAVSLSGESILIGAEGRSPAGITKAGEAFTYKLAMIQLPETGYTQRTAQAALLAGNYAEKQASSELNLEIPKLGVQAGIVSAPRGGSGWETAWLWDQIGYLEETAFPSWPGNTGLAGHTNLPNGLPGPFARLAELSWGDQIRLHAWGQVYIYEVRENKRVFPEDTTVLQHETLDWLTLITCADYDAAQDEFLSRQVVRAVLIEVQEE